jgi:ABC-type transporter Mla MlaB component
LSIRGSQTFALAGSPGVRDAARLAGELQQALSGPGPLAIDCTNLAEIDLSIVQLLVAAHKTAAASGKPLRLIASAGGPLPALLRQTGFVSPDGIALTPEGSLWINAEGKAV